MRSTRIISIKNTPMVIFDPPECISDDIVKYNNFWEFELFNKWKKYFPKEGLMLDIGANIGSHCIQFKYHFPKLKIYAFEPFKENFDVLIQNTKRYKDVKCFNIGVGSRNSIVHFNNGHIQNSGVVRVVDHSSNPNIVLSLDDLILDQVSFIKVDIEGHELSSFEGMRILLKKDKPLIWLEDNENTAVPYLQSLGYKILDKETKTNDYLMI
tara:strand:+ start:96 stop:728 length:633 start_codon:yes stop_codon:yes gene_type:complete